MIFVEFECGILTPEVPNPDGHWCGRTKPVKDHGKKCKVRHDERRSRFTNVLILKNPTKQIWMQSLEKLRGTGNTQMADAAIPDSSLGGLTPTVNGWWSPLVPLVQLPSSTIALTVVSVSIRAFKILFTNIVNTPSAVAAWRAVYIVLRCQQICTKMRLTVSGFRQACLHSSPILPLSLSTCYSHSLPSADLIQSRPTSSQTRQIVAG